MPEVYPRGGDTGFSARSAINSEKDTFLVRGGRGLDHVVDPFNGDFDLTNPTGQDAEIAAGEAIIAGHLTRYTSSVTLSLTDNATHQIYLLVDDEFTDDTDIVYETGGTSPTDPNGNTPEHQFLLWEATTDGSTITGTDDKRDWVAYREQAPEDAQTGRQSGTVQFDGDVTGVQTKPVSVPHAYLTAMDDAIATLDAVSDNAIAFDIPPRVVPGTLSVSGFDVEAELSAAGPSGSTFDVRWNSWGA